jgi:signal transduction histidine kinase
MIEKSSQSRPLEATLTHDVAVNSDRLITTRWLAGVVVLAATLFCVRVLNLPLPETLLYLIGAFILAYNYLLRGMSHQAYTPDDTVYMARIRRLVVWQVALDWLSMAVFLHLTGGVTSPAIAFFFLHVLMVTILLPGQSPYIYAALAVGMVGVIAVMEASGALHHYTVITGLPGDLHTNNTYVLAQIIFFAVALFATVFLTGSIMTRLRERDRQIAALFGTTQAVSSTLNLTDVLHRLARNAAEALSVEAASIRLLDETGDKLTIATTYGLSDAYLDKGPVEFTNPLARQALGGRPIIVPEATADARLQYPEKVVEEGIHSMLVVPITGRTGPLGLLRVYAYAPNHFTQEDADFVMAIARQGATAVENALAHDALQRADQERAQFVRIVTHELRSPVTGAQSLLSVLLRDLAGELTDQQQDIISRLNVRMDNLLALINDLLALAASKSVEQHEPLSAIALKSLLQRIIDRFDAQAKEKQIPLSAHMPDDDLIIRGTEEGLARIFDNLVGNAMKYTPAGGKVDVQLSREANCAVITVSDTGIGIPDEMLDRIGEEFFRATNAKESGITGTGLGLAIVKQLINRFGGLMSVQSTEGEGTTFTVTLPLNDAGSGRDSN